MAEIIKGQTLGEMLDGVMDSHERAVKQLKENGGMCLKCNKNKADTKSQLNGFLCSECNAETEESLKELRKYPGFAEFRMVPK